MSTKDILIAEVKDAVKQLNAGVSQETVIQNFNMCIEPALGFDLALKMSDGFKNRLDYAKKHDIEVTAEFIL